MRVLRRWLCISFVGCFTIACGDEGGTGAASGGSGGTGAASGGSGGSGGGSGGSGGSGNSSGSGGSGNGPSIGGCAVFPAGDEWNRDVSGLAREDGWTTRLMNLVGDRNLHPDFGGAEYGIPISVVPQGEPRLPISFDYDDESDPGPYPFASDVAIEGGTPTSCDGDCHVLVVEQGVCQLWEGYACSYGGGSWNCGSGAKWDLTQESYGQRPKGWTSADAAGLAITPGLLRLDEVMAHDVRHAIRFTTHCTISSFVRPATHQAVPGSCDPADPDAPPMGVRVRLRADFDTSGFSAETRAVLQAMKTYGMIDADNGSDFYFQGERNAAWPDTLIEELKQISVSEFEVIEVPPLEQ